MGTGVNESACGNSQLRKSDEKPTKTYKIANFNRERERYLLQAQGPKAKKLKTNMNKINII